jgi:hypothetical protein
VATLTEPGLPTLPGVRIGHVALILELGAGREEVMQPAPKLAAARVCMSSAQSGNDTLRAIALVKRHQGMVDHATLASAGEQDDDVNEVKALAAIPRLLPRPAVVGAAITAGTVVSARPISSLTTTLKRFQA